MSPLSTKLLSRVQTSCAASVDRATLRVMELVWLAANAGLPVAEASARDEIAQLDREALYPQPPPAPLARRHTERIGRGRLHRCRWRSGYRTWDPAFQATFDAYEENGWARVEWLEHEPRANTTVICLHAWMGGATQIQRRTFRHIWHAGFDVVLFTLPFHGARKSKQARFGGQFFPGRCPKLTNEAFGQLVWDVRGLIGHLQQRGVEHIGVAGMSLGGYGCALLAAVEPRLEFAVPIVPVVDIAGQMWRHGASKPKRLERETGGRTLAQMRALYAVHSPLSYPPLVPKSQRIILAGRGDRICNPDHVERLWDHWDRPAIHWWPGGHVAQFGRGACFARAVAAARATAATEAR